MFRVRYHTPLLLGLLGAILALPGAFVFAKIDVREIQNNLQETSNQISELEQEIKQDEAELDRLKGEKQTLSSTVSSLNASQYRLEKSIKQTESTIQKTEQEILTLSERIAELEQSISQNRKVIGTTVREIYKSEDTSVFEALLIYDTFSEFLAESDALRQTGVVLKKELGTLEATYGRLKDTTQEKAQAKYKLETEQENLQDRKQVVAYTKRSKETLLKETQNKEEVYQRTLAEKRQALREFEAQMQQLELELNIAIDESRVQDPLVGLFSWPFSNWYRITQFFGNTSYASSGAYNGRGHSGVDFATPLGTPILSPMDGVVMAADDTGAHGARINGSYQQCISYGKWIVVDHQNGLSTRVNHLSLIKVRDGERVRRGQVIGYSGNTGISTGPHLHVSVAATQGVQIRRLGDVITTTACRDARAPIISSNAYRDPFDYFPRPHFTLSEVALGDRGTSVRNLQMMLKHERIFPIEISANGVYGPTTAKAVLKWQKKYRVDNPSELDAQAGKSFGEASLKRYQSFF
ncbi:MAG: peptidoglycan DD-metalloendopeptidase family protein [Patescibacteria group bacterium]